ncbi:MAG: hypothetical protein NT027_03930 [Proteobacteria bacterium]|nr:hypothetical protein [Pseudomonadota bacterium]
MSAVKSKFKSSRAVSNEVSIISLDGLTSSTKLTPGTSHRLADGVTISVLQAAAEGLIEIDHEAAGKILIDGKPTSEIATIHPGQIIKTSQGRFVMVRHLQALIVPRERNYTRPANYEDAIRLALSAINADSQVLVPSINSVQSGTESPLKHSLPPAQDQVQPKSIFESQTPSSVQNIDKSQKRFNSKSLLRAAILLLSGGLIALYFLSPQVDQPISNEKQAETTKKSANAKSRIIPIDISANDSSEVSSQSQSQSSDRKSSGSPIGQSSGAQESEKASEKLTQTTTNLEIKNEHRVSVAENEKIIPSQKQVAVVSAPSAVDALKAANTGETPRVTPRPAVKPSSNIGKVDTSTQKLAKNVKLSEKDKQTVMEYKLEARFDRGNARAKMKHFANSFPIGSQARADLEREYRGM